ncbi:hypothetical protein ABRG53_3231 [Pseudanabaena sp. ABRG5-3]|jgi:hypothetical protein|nr:hypothetical protein ABRG53_3231 [Pseudanabaena sp. ABRG5-3]
MIPSLVTSNQYLAQCLYVYQSFVELLQFHERLGVGKEIKHLFHRFLNLILFLELSPWKLENSEINHHLSSLI